MNNLTLTLAATFTALSLAPAFATDTAPARFDPAQTFAPYSYPQPATAYRSASGKPGPMYWQNRADYRIKATLDPATRLLSGSEVISYTNHSPDALDVLWLQLDQNRYRKDARGAFTSKFPPSSPTATGSARSRSKTRRATRSRCSGSSPTPACRCSCRPR